MSDSNAWTNEWLKAQQKFVESWSDMARGVSTPKATSASDLWSDSFDLWRKQYASPSGDVNQVIDKCMNIGRGYFSMAEQIGKQISSGGKPQEAINKLLEQLKSTLQQQADSWPPFGHQPDHDFMSQWATPSASWQKLAMAIMPIQFPESNPSIYGIGEDFDQLSQVLSVPGIGFFRESQEKHQQGINLARHYFQSNHKFNLALLQVSIESLQAFQKKLNNLYEANKTQSPASLRALYDLWVDTSEAHYADFAMSTEYQSLYGDMVNKLMALKKHYSDIVDDFLQSLNLPSRHELDTLEQRVQQLRRDNHGLRKELKEIRSLLTNSPAKQSKSTQKKKSAKKAVKAGNQK